MLESVRESQWKRRDKTEKTQGEKDLICNASFKKGMRVTLEAEDNLWPTVNKERGTSILPSYGAGFCQQPEWALKQIPPESLQARK